MKLSIFLAGIRTRYWKALYESIPNTTSIDDYELIIVGPYDLPPELEGDPKIRVIKDYGCPSRCYQLGLKSCQGEYVVWAADDGTFSPTKAIDQALAAIPKHHKGVVSLKYWEGATGPAGQKQMGPEWWRIRRHKTLRRCPYANANYFMVMNALIRRDYFMELGGFDCRFEHLGLGAVDVAVRLQNDGAEVVLGDKFMDIDDDNSAEHEPIRLGQTENDYPLFVKLYTHKSGARRTKVELENWQKAQDVWTRRFSVKHLP